MEENNKKDLLQDIEPENRLEALRNMADKTEEQIVARKFSPDQIAKLKDDLAESAIEHQVLNNELEKIKKEYSMKMKPLQEAKDAATKSLRLKYSETLEEVYMIADQEAGVMRTYDSNGIFLSERRLLPSERQMSISHVGAKAS